ncbi:hypothetical protein CXG81DRAFT_9491, partial [Caulochytrium protostelioides]
MVLHGETWHDDFAWLTRREDPAVRAYIQAENAYTDAMLADTGPLQRTLYSEFVSRLDEEEETPRVALPDGYAYFSKKVSGQEYRMHCRAVPPANGASVDPDVDVYFDENAIALLPHFKDAPYFKVGFLKHTMDGSILAYSVDSTGNEHYTVYFMEMATRTHLPDQIADVYEDMEFSNDGRCVFYTRLDGTERAYQMRVHVLGTPVDADVVLYEEPDDMFFLTLFKGADTQFILMCSSAQITSETHYISAATVPSGPQDLHLLLPREEGIQYTVDSHIDVFYVLTNEGSKNNWLFTLPIPDRRQAVIEPRDFVMIETFHCHEHHLIVYERSNCVPNVRVVDLRDNTYHYISFSDTVYSLYPGTVNEEVAELTRSVQFGHDTHLLRFTYGSFTQPKQVIEYNMDTRQMTVLSEEKVPAELPYDPSFYVSRRLFATGHDGTAVPISIVYRRDLLGQCQAEGRPSPMLLHAYGAYGSLVNPMFSSTRLSLLDRGFVYAVVHTRGGGDLGNGWYEDGKLAKKPNTFHDFISAAEHLIKEGYTSPEKLAIYGRSAGGLLITAVVNMRPDLFRAALTEVPFVDVINTMSNPAIPWTAYEYEEWGNPENREIYDAMKTYCPYTNISGPTLAAEGYPHLMVIGGMNDPRVAFFEPLKYVAKLR